MSTRPRSASSASDAAVPFQVPERVGRTPGKREIFRAMLEWEAMSGSLTPSRRRRLVRYAAQLGLSATQAGELIRACVDRPRTESDLTQEEPEISMPNLRYVPAPAAEPGAALRRRWGRLAPFFLASMVIAVLLVLRLLR